MRCAVVLGLVATLAGCGGGFYASHAPRTPVVDLPLGYPPKVGDVNAAVNGVAQHWEVYDYSIGAMDSAAQIRDNGGAVEFRLLGVPAGSPMGDSNRLAVRATLAGKLAEGATRDVVIEIIAGKDWDGLRLSSVGQAVELVIEDVQDQTDGGYGHARGRLSAMLCAATGNPVRVDTSRCQPIQATFDTDIQFEGL